MTNIIKTLEIRGERTPDFKEFKKKHEVILFVYDNMMSSGTEGFLLSKHGKNLGRTRTHSDQYSLRKFDSATPVLLDDNDKNSFKQGYVFGEAWAVPPEVLLILDEMKSNGEMFSRKKRSILLIEQDTVLKSGARPYSQGYIYIGIPGFWKDMKLTAESSYITPSGGYIHNSSKQKRFYQFIPPKKTQEKLLDDYTSLWGPNLDY